MPFAWSGIVGFTWHSAQSSAFRIGPFWTCFWCAPTAIAEVSVSPRVPTGGAGFTPSVPWHIVQVTGTMSRVPSMCWPPATSMRESSAVVVPGWQRLQSIRDGCGNPGGAAWHVPQDAWPSPTRVQTGAVTIPSPRESVAPWQ